MNSAYLRSHPLLTPSAVALGMLSLSIGWGIRGNFGHEFGAMMPGLLCAVAIALFSGREDWRARVPFFAIFGAIGWGFGGSMAYMPTISYTQSGHLPTQIYGWLVVFAIGFLWASLGGAGTAFAAVETRERLTHFFQPLCWVLVIWTLDELFFSRLATWYIQAHAAAGFDATEARQRNPFYWLDSDWIPAAEALLAVALFDLWRRRFSKLQWLAVYGAAGAAAGLAIQQILSASGLLPQLLSALVHPQGDLTATDPATGAPFAPDGLITNWPQIFFDLGPHMGWILGLIVGLFLYFRKHGEFDCGSGLIASMAAWGYAIFLAGPVLLSNVFKNTGGFRMVPPRGDNWAFVLGTLIGLILYMRRHGLRTAADVSLLSGLIGGLGFMLMQFFKILAIMLGNPAITQDPGTVQAWSHWRSTNWHSLFAEQGAGLFYGLAIVLPMAWLSLRTKPTQGEPRVRRWTEEFSVFFILNGLLYVNLVKNVSDWTRVQAGGFRSVPLTMKAPLMSFWEMSALGWFNLIFALITISTLALLVAHRRKPLAVIPNSWLGKGQMFFLAFLWAIVIGNFEKALVSFTDRRLVTEALIFVNALIVTFLILACAPDAKAVQETRSTPLPRRWLLTGAAAVLLFTFAFTAVTHSVYGDQRDGFGGTNIRFGPKADWRTRPIQLTRPHR